jgi:hypothetical protein
MELCPPLVLWENSFRNIFKKGNLMNILKNGSFHISAMKWVLDIDIDKTFYE